MFGFSWLRLVACFFSMTLVFLTPASASVQSEQDQPEELVVALEEFPDTLDPRGISFSKLEQSLEHLLFLPLFASSADGLPREVLAERAIYKSPTILELRLRAGLKFANGREMDADDVVATYRFILGTDKSVRESPRKVLFSNIASIKRVSKRAVRVHLNREDSSVLSLLNIGILPKEVFNEGGGSPRAASLLVGYGAESGPFILSAFEGREITFTRNKKYTGAPFGGSLPALEKIKFKLLGSRQAIYDALVAGEVDFVQNSLDQHHLSELRSKHSARFDVQQVVADETWFLGFNLRKKPFTDLRVRRAIALAVDIKEVLNFSMMGSGYEAKSVFPPRNYFYPRSLSGLTQSTREARILLESAGLVDQRDRQDNALEEKSQTHFRISVPLEKERIAVAKALAGQLKNVGLNVGVEISEFNVFSKKLASGQTDAWIAPWSGFRDGDFLRFALHSQYTPPSGGNAGFYSNKKLDATLEQALRTADISRRKSLYDQAQGIIAQDFPYLFLWHSVNFAVANRRFKGFEVFPDARLTGLSSVRKR